MKTLYDLAMWRFEILKHISIKDYAICLVTLLVIYLVFAAYISQKDSDD